MKLYSADRVTLIIPRRQSDADAGIEATRTLTRLLSSRELECPLSSLLRAHTLPLQPVASERHRWHIFYNAGELIGERSIQNNKVEIPHHDLVVIQKYAKGGEKH